MFGQDNWIVAQNPVTGLMRLFKFGRITLSPLKLGVEEEPKGSQWPGCPNNMLTVTVAKKKEKLNGRNFDQNGSNLGLLHPCLTWKLETLTEGLLCEYGGYCCTNGEQLTEKEATCRGCFLGPLPLSECSSVVV